MKKGIFFILFFLFPALSAAAESSCGNGICEITDGACDNSCVRANVGFPAGMIFEEGRAIIQQYGWDIVDEKNQWFVRPDSPGYAAVYISREKENEFSESIVNHPQVRYVDSPRRELDEVVGLGWNFGYGTLAKSDKCNLIGWEEGHKYKSIETGGIVEVVDKTTCYYRKLDTGTEGSNDMDYHILGATISFSKSARVIEGHVYNTDTFEPYGISSSNPRDHIKDSIVAGDFCFDPYLYTDDQIELIFDFYLNEIKYFLDEKTPCCLSGGMLVAFREGVDENEINSIISSLNEEPTQYNPSANWVHVQLENNSEFDFKAALETSPQVRYVQCEVVNFTATAKVEPGYIENEESLCIENWKCSRWSSCINNQQTKTCDDLHNCGTEKSKPKTLQGCTVDQQQQDGESDNEANYIYHWIVGITLVILVTIFIVLVKNKPK